MKRIILLGPVAWPGKPARGGYQSSNLRLLRLLRNFAPVVDAFRYPETQGGRPTKAIFYVARFLQFALALGKRSGRESAVHFTPLFRQFIVAELVLAVIARSRGYFLTIDIRAGSQANHYDEFGRVYRWLFRRLMSCANAVTYEGEPYQKFVDRIAPGRSAGMLPNYVDTENVKIRSAPENHAAPRLLYVGAISEAKGVTSALQAFRVLQRTYPAATFTLVGTADPNYRAQLAREQTDDRVIWTGPLAPLEVQRKLDEADFFVFLSLWFGEGQSNALTEAMARGCVPIVTRHGFNEPTVGSPDLVVNDREDSEAVAARISGIWQSGDWQTFSNRMVSRVSDNFTNQNVIGILRRLY
jgi:glycosyltransferase involved in cell wall biosynthesis